MTAGDFARTRFARHPAPLQELNTAFLTMLRPDGGVLVDQWRGRLLRTLPPATLPLRDLAPGPVFARSPGQLAPRFLDQFGDSLVGAQETIRSTRPELIRSEVERMYAGRAGRPPAWLRDLHRADATAWQPLLRAQRAAFETVLRPVWSLIQDLHRHEFTRHALATAEHGLAAALTQLVPGSELRDGIWQITAALEQTVDPGGRGVLLLPTFHWTGSPLVADLPEQPVVVTYPAGPGFPPLPGGPSDPDQALAGVLGRTRHKILLELGRELTTSEIARRLGISNATASEHASALHGAGLVASTRTGQAVVHRRTSLGDLLVHQSPSESHNSQGHP